MKRPASRRPRVARRALDAARRAPAAGGARERVGAALERCTSAERTVLALMLDEGLTAREAAAALDRPAPEVARLYAHLLAELRRAANGARFRADVVDALSEGERLRRAA